MNTIPLPMPSHTHEFDYFESSNPSLYCLTSIYQSLFRNEWHCMFYTNLAYIDFITFFTSTVFFKPFLFVLFNVTKNIVNEILTSRLFGNVIGLVYLK